MIALPICHLVLWHGTGTDVLSAVVNAAIAVVAICMAVPVSKRPLQRPRPKPTIAYPQKHMVSGFPRSALAHMCKQWYGELPVGDVEERDFQAATILAQLPRSLNFGSRRSVGQCVARGRNC